MPFWKQLIDRQLANCRKSAG